MPDKAELQKLLEHLRDEGLDLPVDLNAIAAEFEIDLFKRKLNEAHTRDIDGVRTDGQCPKCGGDLEDSSGSIEALCDDTAFPTISLEFTCSICGHIVEVDYDAVTVELNYDDDE